jgi:hypothetical protein
MLCGEFSPAKNAVRVKTVYPLIYNVSGEWNDNHKDNPIIPTIDRVFYADEDEINKWLVSNTPMNHWAFIELQCESLFIKRREFEHEKEVRVILSTYNKEEKEYVEVDFDPNKVFREIVIDPRVTDEEFAQQRNCLVEHGYNGDKIRKSTLYDFHRVKLEVDLSEPCDFQITMYGKDGKPHKETLFMKGPEGSLK